MSAISFQCGQCGKGFKVGPDMAGKKARCNQCGTVLTVPAPGGARAETPTAVKTPAGPPVPPPLPPPVAEERPVPPAYAEYVPDEDTPPPPEDRVQQERRRGKRR